MSSSLGRCKVCCFYSAQQASEATNTKTDFGATRKKKSHEEAEYRSLCEKTEFLRQIPLLVLLQNQWILHSSVNHQQLSSCQS